MTLSSEFDDFARRTVDLAGPEPKNWVADSKATEHNVVIVGGGQSGCALAFALRRAGIGKVTVIETALNEEQTGIWLTTARMNTLRTPKEMMGPELGIQGLSFKAWYTARHGLEAYDALVRIPRLDWAEYLSWYRKFLDIPVRYGTTLQRIEPLDDGLRLHLSNQKDAWSETARKVILATGFASLGGGYVPEVISRNLPRDCYAHTSERIDFPALRGKTVAVVGAAASAFDAAATALEAGAADVHLFARRNAIAATTVGFLRAYAGALDNYPDLPADMRWQQAFRTQSAGTMPPPDSISRATCFSNFHIHLSAPWNEVRYDGERIEAITGDVRFQCDYVIAATGYRVDLTHSTPINGFADEILLWEHQHQPQPDMQSETLGKYPYLGLGYEFLEQRPGSAPYLRDIHAYNLSALVSFGYPVGDVPSMTRGIPAVAARISRDLFFNDISEHRRRFSADLQPMFSEELYRQSIWRK